MIALILSAALAAAPLPAGEAPAAVAAPAAPVLEAITFEEAVRRAVARSTGALVAAQEVARTQALRDETSSASLPTLGATGIYTRLDGDRTTVSGGTSRILSAQDQLNASATLSVPLLAPSRWYQWSHARQAVAAAAEGGVDARRQAALQAGHAYLSVLSLRNALKVADSALQTARAHADFAHTRRSAGMGNALDELQAIQEVSASEVQLAAVQDGLARAREALGVATGGDAPLDAADVPALAPPAARGDQVVELEHRSDVRTARARALVADRTAADGWADWLPTLLGTAQAFLQAPASLTTPAHGWQVQVILSLPIYDGGFRPGQARERDALKAESDLAVDALLRQARSDVRASWTTLSNARTSFEAARRGAKASAEALELSETAYRAGAVNSLQVTDAQRRARDAGLAAVAAEEAERQAVLDLLAATGNFP